jgi:hypothetical protein
MTGPYLFTGADPGDAMAAALEALGEEAMILSVTRKGDETEVVACPGTPDAPQNFAEALAAAKAAQPVGAASEPWSLGARPRLLLVMLAGAPALETACAVGAEFSRLRGAPLRLVLPEALLGEAETLGLEAEADLAPLPAPHRVAPPGGRFAEVWVLTGPDARALADEALSEGLCDCLAVLPTGLRRTRAITAAEGWLGRASGLLLTAPPEAPVEDADRQAASASGLPLRLIAELAGAPAAAGAAPPFHSAAESAVA